jgi:hypothetical protein
MKKGINLTLTKSLYDFNLLLERVIETLPSENRSIKPDFSELFPDILCFCKHPFEYRIGKEVFIEETDSITSSSYNFWIGFGWEENGKRESCLWLEFVKKNCGAKYRKKLNNLIGTSGKYYQEVVSRSTHDPKNAMICFYMKYKYLKQFYDENTGLSAQEEILTGFINEVLDKSGIS